MEISQEGLLVMILSKSLSIGLPTNTAAQMNDRMLSLPQSLKYIETDWFNIIFEPYFFDNRIMISNE